MSNPVYGRPTRVNKNSLFIYSNIKVELEGEDLLLAQESGSTRATLGPDKNPQDLHRINQNMIEPKISGFQSSCATFQLQVCKAMTL